MRNNTRILTLVFVVAFLTLLVGCIPVTPIEENQAPVITSTPVTTAKVGIPYTYDVDATDPDGDTLTYSLTLKPSGMTINSVNGLIKWTPTAKGNYAVVVKVSDGDLDIIQSFTIVVSEPTAPPETYTITASAGPRGSISPLGDVTVDKGSDIKFTSTPNTNYVIDKVLVDGGSVGAVSTYTFNNVAKDHIIHATFSTVEPDPEIELTGIVVDPKTMTLFVGESEAIKSVTATYEIRGLEVPVLPGDCTYLSTDEDVATIEKGNFGKVTVTAEGVGTATIIVNYGGKTDTISVTVNPVLLTSIVVEPETMSLFVGEEEGITSVTAYYDDGSKVKIDLDACDYESDNEAVATVWFLGLVSAKAEGTATITVSYAGMTDTLEVTVSAIVYRALCVGVGDYQNFPDAYGNIDLLGPPYDVDRIIDVFDHCKFGTDEVVFSTPVSLKDSNATKTAIMSGIASTFSGADDNDISYFYFSGHGSYAEGYVTSYILPTDFDGTVNFAISVDELESALSAIPGSKVVILDSCYSGGFIGKSKGEITISKEELISFNDEIINVFSQAQLRGLLTTNEYKVLTSCHYDQPCWEASPHPVDGNPFGLFSVALCEGCGYNTYNHPYLADNDENNIVSLNEAYLYVKNWVQYYFSDLQDVQVYPNNSTYPIVEY